MSLGIDQPLACSGNPGAPRSHGVPVEGRLRSIGARYAASRVPRQRLRVMRQESGRAC